MLQINSLCKDYGTTKALQNANLSFIKGRIYACLGRNGAGKTTLVNIITNRAFATSGRVLIDGEPAKENDFAQERVFCITERSEYPKQEKVKSLFVWAKRFYPKFDLDYAYSLSEKFNLDINKKMGRLSTGYATITKVILTLSSNADYMIFDEPVLGIDSIYREIFYTELKEKFAALNNCVILCTHIIDEIEAVASDAVIIKGGEIVFNKQLKNLPTGETLQSYYLKIHKDEQAKFEDCQDFFEEQAVINENETIGEGINAPAKKGIDKKKIGISLKYLLSLNWVIVAIVFALSIIFTILSLTTPAEIAPEIMILSNVIFLSVIAHGYYFRYALYNGVSRKTYFLSVFLLILAYGVIFSLLGTATVAIQMASGLRSGIFFWLYRSTVFTVGTFFSLFAWLFSGSMFLMLFSLFFMILFQTLPRKGRIIMLAILAALLLVIVLWATLAPSSIAAMLLFFFGLIHFSSYAAAAFSFFWQTLLAVLFGVLCYIFVKRQEVK